MAYLGSTPARAPLSSAQIEDGTIDTADLATNAVTTAKITAANVTTAKIADANVTKAKIAGGSALIGRNLLDNGDMIVKQRGSLTGLGAAAAYTTMDRWELRIAASPQGRVSTSSSSLSKANSILLEGNRFSLEIDCTTAESAVAAGEFIIITQKIEAQNLQHLLFGSEGSQQALSLRFGFRSPKSGTHCVALYSADGNRNIVKEFTVAAADTFETIRIENIPGDALGTINNDTGEGLRVAFPLVAGTDFQVAADSWAGGEDYATSNQQNLLDNTANNIYIAGVQLEVGSVSTDFEFELQSVTLQKCQRYLVAIGDTNGGLGVRTGMAAVRGGTTIFDVVVPHPVSMRAAPTYSGELDWPQAVFRGVGYNGTGGSISASITATRFNVTGASSLTIADAGYYDYRGSHGGFLSAEL
jgi:hypothetical protein